MATERGRGKGRKSLQGNQKNIWRAEDGGPHSVGTKVTGLAIQANRSSEKKDGRKGG